MFVQSFSSVHSTIEFFCQLIILFLQQHYKQVDNNSIYPFFIQLLLQGNQTCANNFFFLTMRLVYYFMTIDNENNFLCNWRNLNFSLQEISRH